MKLGFMCSTSATRTLEAIPASGLGTPRFHYKQDIHALDCSGNRFSRAESRDSEVKERDGGEL